MQWPVRGMKPLFLVVCTLIFFLVIKLAISYTVSSSFFRVIIDAQFEQAERVQVYYAAHPFFSEKQSRHTEEYPGGLRESRKVDINNHVARQFRIDLGDSIGTVRLYGLRLTSFFFPEMHFSPAGITEAFIPGPGVSMELKGEYVAVHSSSTDPYIQIRGSLQHHGFFLSWFLPLLITLCFYLFLSSFSLKDFPATADVLQKQSSAGLHFAALDGVRGMAALVVLAEHVGIMTNGIGVIGVHLFFALSGFLLAIPFTRQPERAFSLEYMRAYMLRRLKRIIPMYYTIITVLFLFRHKNPDVFRHYLFMQGDGYLWTVPQEMFFYILLPVLVLMLCLLTRIQKWLGPLALLIAIIVATHLSHKGLITLYGNGDRRPVLAGIFMSGMFFSYLFHTLQTQAFWREGSGRICRRILAVAGTLTLAFLLVVASRQIPSLHSLDIYQNYGYSGFLAAFIIFTVISAQQSFLARFMALTPLRAVGVVSFSFYLLHPTFIAFCDEITRYYFNVDLSPIARFFVVGAVTYGFAAFTYSCIERPFMK